MKICILTAGKGTRMGVSSKQINKALLPIDHKAVISHIIEKFSIDDVFVIALGYKGDQVINYLKSAHPKNKFEFVQVENFDREGSGPGLSLISCMENLQEPFLFFACDGLFFDEINNFDHNWIGISKINSNESSSYCNISIDNGKVLEIRDKQKCDDSFYAFTGSMFVKDFDIFWDSLKENKMVNGEHQLSNGFKGLMDKHSLYGYQNDWRDVGDWEKYQTVQKQFDSASMLKTNEFIYFINNRVLKFYADSSITDNRVKKSKINEEIFPRVEKAGDNFYWYPFWDGETLYSCITPQLCKKLLEWLDEKVWNRQDIKSELMKDACHDFYHKKTLKRISLFNQNVKGFVYLAGIIIADIGLGLFEEALKITEQCIEQYPDTVFYIGLKASILGHLNREIESNKCLKQYLDFRPNLKTRTDYKKMFVPNSVLVDTIIDGLIKAGWKPED